MSIPVATNSANGYLSSADWLTFSSKQNAITLTTTGNNGSATLVGATLNIPTYTLDGLGGMGNPMTSLGDMIYGNAVGIPLRVPANTSTTKKFLAMTGDGTSGDQPFWDTITSGVSGTTNYVAKFTSSSAIGNSIIFDNGTNVGIGSITPDARLRVSASSANTTQAIFGNIDGRGLAISTSQVAGTNEAGSILNARGASSGTLIFQNDGTEAARIDSSRNLIIGNTSASGRLHVQSTTAGTSLYLTDAVNSTLYITHPSTGRTSFYNGTNTRWLTESGAVVGLEGSLAVGGIVANAKVQISGGALATGGNGIMISSGLTNGRLDTYQAGTTNCIHTWLDDNTYEISCGSTSGYISGISITGRNATLHAGTIRMFVHSLERFTLNSTGQIGLTAYNSATSFTGTPVAYLACDSGGNIITSNPSGIAKYMSVAFNTVGNTWLDMPSALSFFDSSNTYVTQLELSSFNQVRLVVNKLGTAGATGSKLILRFQDTTGAPFTASSYSDIGTSEVSVTVDVANNILVSSWINLATAAKDDVWVALLGVDGDGAIDPTFGNIYAEFRYNP
jgi:hypothetical protein